MLSLSRFVCAVVLLAGSGIASASLVTPTGFFYPIGDDNLHVSECGRWLTKPVPVGCYPSSGVYHIGVDIMADKGTPVRAIADGKVVNHIGVLSQAFGAGNLALLVEHESVEKGTSLFLYGHVQIDGAKGIGASVKAGEVIGKIGYWSGGNHLHFGAIDPALDDAIDKGSYGRWPNDKYGIPSKSGYFDNGFIDPIYFIAHHGAKNPVSCEEQRYINLPAMITRNHPCFAELCPGVALDGRCDPDDTVLYTECVYEGSTLCAAPSSVWSATEHGNSTSGNPLGAGGDSGGSAFAQTDLEVSPKEYLFGTGQTYAEGATISVGTTLDLKATTKVTNGDASLGMKSGDNKVTVRWEASYDNGASWMKVGGDKTIDKSNLKKGDWTAVTWTYTIPSIFPDGVRMKFRVTTDVKGVVLEIRENNNQKTETFILKGVAHQGRSLKKFLEMIED